MTGGLESFTLGEKRGPSGTPPLAQPQQSSTKFRRSTSFPVQRPPGPAHLQQAQGPQPIAPNTLSALHILQHSQLGSSRTRTVDEAKFGRYREPTLLRDSSTLSSSSDEQSTGASDATLPSYATPFRRALSSGNLGSTSMSHPFATPARRPASITPSSPVALQQQMPWYQAPTGHLSCQAFTIH
jgi:hypothetical protein